MKGLRFIARSAIIWFGYLRCRLACLPAVWVTHEVHAGRVGHEQLRPVLVAGGHHHAAAERPHERVQRVGVQVHAEPVREVAGRDRRAVVGPVVGRLGARCLGQGARVGYQTCHRLRRTEHMSQPAPEPVHTPPQLGSAQGR